MFPSTFLMMLALFAASVFHFVQPGWVINTLCMALGFGIATVFTRLITGGWTY